MKEKSTWSFQVVIHLKYPVWSWSLREKIKQMSDLFRQDTRALTNSFDPSVALGDTMGWFLQLLASQVVTNELGEDDDFSLLLWDLSFICPSLTWVTLDLTSPSPTPPPKKDLRA